MSVVRCPECGNRLKTNYCDMCMKTVPFPGLQKKTVNWQTKKYESPYERDHTCIDFNGEIDSDHRKTIFSKTVMEDFSKKAKSKKNKNLPIKKIAVFVAVFSLLSSLSTLFDELSFEDEQDHYSEVLEDEYIQGGSVEGLEDSSIAPQTIYQENGITIVADSSGNYYDDYSISMDIVNHSEHDVTISTDILAVNGYMMSSSGMFVDVPAGEGARSYLCLYADELELAGIKQIGQVQFDLNIWDSKEYTTIGSVDLITLQSDVAKDFVQPVDDSGSPIYANDTVRLLLKQIEMDSYGDCTVTLFVENTSDKMVSISADRVQINNEVCGSLWSILRPNSRAITQLYLYDLEDLDITDISQIEEIGLNLRIEYMEDWLVEETIEETVMLQVNG